MGLEVMAFAGIAASLAGAGISAYSSYQQGQAANAMAKHNAKVASNAATNEAQVAQQNAIRQREASRRQLASIRSKMASSGTAIGAGSSLDVLGTAASELELKTLDLFRDSDAKQRQYNNEATMTLWEGKQAAKAGTIGALGTLIGGVGSAMGSYTDARKSGVIRTGKP